uniref:Uncharacterized protein n=1 Tax=Fagus sylvatica TaxID=28930 RepID=A0A2N9H1X7_FAGSY
MEVICWRLWVARAPNRLINKTFFGVDVWWAWGFLPVRVSSDYPTLGLDYSKLFLLKSPYHTRIEWQIRFDFASKPTAVPIGCCGCS